ncbi:MAG: YgiT-type zinc finger protein [Betaproteobacteria bacterium]
MRPAVSRSRGDEATGLQSCASCGSGGVQLKHVTRGFGSGVDLLVIEAIPLWSCPRCGESYFTAQTLHEVERIKAMRHSIAVKRAVAVAAFVEAV